MKKEAKKVAGNHWQYIEALLGEHREDRGIIRLIGFHYKSAFIHGWKHGIEAKKRLKKVGKALL